MILPTRARPWHKKILHNNWLQRFRRFAARINSGTMQPVLDLSYRPLRHRERWFAYFDLLGFTSLVESKTIEQVLPVYAEALKRMRVACQLGKTEVGLLSAWFSDTFIIYTREDTLEHFAHLESASRVFFQLLLTQHIPVRGCISHGRLYSQAKQNVFIGPALIEAHMYGEALDWVGYCLAPSVEEKLQNVLPLNERQHYRPLDDRNILRQAVGPLYAFAFNTGTVNGRNHLRDALVAMQHAAPSGVAGKYANSLAFLDRFS